MESQSLKHALSKSGMHFGLNFIPMLTLANICTDSYKKVLQQNLRGSVETGCTGKNLFGADWLFSLNFEQGNNSPVFDILCFALAYSGTPPYDHLGNMVTLLLRPRLFGRPAKRP